MIQSFWQKVKSFFSLKRVLVLVVIGLAVGFGVVGVRSQKTNQPVVQTETVQSGEIIATVTGSGTVITANLTDVTTQASGVVKTIYVTDGDWVAKGAKIADLALDLNGQQAQAQAYASYLSAKNSLASAKTSKLSLESAMWQAHEEFESKSLDTGLSVDDPIYIQTERDWRAAEQKYLQQDAVISQSQASLNNAWLAYVESQAVITAPVAGTLNSLSIAEGMQLNSALTSSGTRTSQRVAAIYAEGKPLASFNISEVDISAIRVGQKATITADALTDKTFTGEVVSVDRVGTVTSNVTTYTVLARLDTASEDLLPNMAVSANIIVNRQNNTLLIPSSAIQSQNGQDVVTVVNNGQQTKVPVELGISSDTQTEVISGLAQGDEIVVSTTISSNANQNSAGSSPFGSFGGGRFIGR